MGGVLQVLEDERPENAPTNLRLYTVYYRCKTYKPFSAEEIAKRESEEAVRQAAREADYEKAKALVADPKAYLKVSGQRPTKDAMPITRPFSWATKRM